MASYSGSWWVWGKVSNDSIYVNNMNGNYNTVTFNNGNGQAIYEGSTPASDARNFTVTSVKMKLVGTEMAKASYTIKAWLGNGTYAGESGEAYAGNTAGNGTSYSKELTLSGGSIGLSNILSPSNTFYIQVGTTSKTGNKIQFKKTYGDSWIWVSYTWEDNYTNVGNPTSVSVTRNKGTFSISWSGATNGTNNSVAGYEVVYGTSKTEPGTVIVSKTTSTSTTHSPAAGTYYYGVKSLPSVSGWGPSTHSWSSGKQMLAKPSTISGMIYSNSMEPLKNWIQKGNLPTEYTRIDASLANTYAASAVSTANKILASWYNNQL